MTFYTYTLVQKIQRSRLTKEWGGGGGDGQETISNADTYAHNLATVADFWGGLVREIGHRTEVCSKFRLIGTSTY